MSETTTVVDTETPAEETEVQIPNVTLAVVGGTLLGIATVYVAGAVLVRIKARRAAKLDTVDADTDAK